MLCNLLTLTNLKPKHKHSYNFNTKYARYYRLHYKFIFKKKVKTSLSDLYNFFPFLTVHNFGTYSALHTMC